MLQRLAKALSKNPNGKMVTRLNSYIIGIQNYFKIATRVNLEFNRIWYYLTNLLYNRLKNVAEYGVPRDPPDTYRRLYGKYQFKT